MKLIRIGIDETRNNFVTIFCISFRVGSGEVGGKRVGLISSGCFIIGADGALRPFSNAHFNLYDIKQSIPVYVN